MISLYLQKLILPLIIILFFFLMLFAYSKIVGPFNFSINNITTTKSDEFRVTGEGKTSATPDVAVVRVGVQANGLTADDTKEQLNVALNKVSEAIKSLGISSTDIKTENYNIYPNQDYNDGKNKITGYTASSNLVIKVKEVEKANQVLDVSVSSGANQVGGVTFEVSDKSAAENEAREKAVADARKKAELMARVAGFKLGKVINYSENFGDLGGIRSLAVESKDVSGGTPTQLEPGSNEIIVYVTLSFEIQ